MFQACVLFHFISIIVFFQKPFYRKIAGQLNFFFIGNQFNTGEINIRQISQLDNLFFDLR